ncbi:cadherin-related family member 3-like [Argopecten irradians]|uniref:cadherin-related family member 3-like n=1 Tax=Argopecten irradians TaxID=31199 RepID=UPI003723378C
MTYKTACVVSLIVLVISNEVTAQFGNLPNSASIAENSPGGTPVFTITISTRPFSPLDYIIQYDPPETETLFLVSVVPVGFAVTVKQGATLDYETLPNQYQIILLQLGIEGSGEGELVFPTGGVQKRQALPNTAGIGVLDINITNVNEPPEFSSPNFFITAPESSVSQDPFVVLPGKASDVDVNDTLWYEINNIFPSVEGTRFDINRTTGNILLLGGYDVDNNIDPDVLIFTLQVIDQGGLFNTTTLIVNIIDIDDNVPVFTGSGSYDILIPEDYAKITGVNIGYVHADDADGSDTVTYAIVTGNMYFSVESSTGFIQLISPLPLNTVKNGVLTFSVAANSGLRRNINPVTAHVKVWIVPFCTAEDERGCDLCNESSTTTTPPKEIQTATPTLLPSRKKRVVDDTGIDVCPTTMCSKCRHYLTSTCSDGTVPLTSLTKQPACPTQTGDVTYTRLDICWIIPLVVAVGIATIIIALCLYKNQKKTKTAPSLPENGLHNNNLRKPDIITVATT